MKNFSLGSFGAVTLSDDGPLSWCAPSSSEMARLDAETISSGTPSVELMERAGQEVAQRVARLVQAHNNQQVVVLCGAGNNGGDGLVIARALSTQGISVTAVVNGASSYSTECTQQLERCPAALVYGGKNCMASLTTHAAISHKDLTLQLGRATVVVDALLGTGQRDAPRGAIADLVNAVNDEKARRPSICVVSVDLPTGINADTGAVYTPHIIADRTVTVELLKRGMMQFPARATCGDIEVVGIGISGREGIDFSVEEGRRIPRIKRRASDAHKGMQGRVLVVGGSAAMPGASALAALGALRAGAGLVTRTVKASWTGAEVAAECMNLLVPGDEPHYDDGDVAAVAEGIAAADTIVIGPGLGRHPETIKFLAGCIQMIRRESKRFVIDADALTLIITGGLDIRGMSGIVTPHPGEAGAMLGLSTDLIQGDRFLSVKALHERCGVVSLLKGAGTLIWDGTQGSIIARGTPYLATAGSGDVLSGILAVCLMQCSTVRDAAVCGAYIHAVAGERASASSGGPIIASDIARAAASVIGELEV